MYHGYRAQLVQQKMLNKDRGMKVRGNFVPHQKWLYVFRDFTAIVRRIDLQLILSGICLEFN